MVLHLAPHLVKNHRNVHEVPFGNPFEPAHRGWTMPDRSEPGHVGNPREAAAEKGAALLEMFARDAVAMIERMVAWDGKSWEG
jgi:creatinine amidohydrolase